MITQTELNISNKQYVDKDFPVVYWELLDLCTKLSNRWMPDQSNESDPGLVLLKLLAFIADKNNYNIDKNVLECFLPSATQETSARNLFEMNGYDMQYYVSATTPISFLYTNDLDSSFTLKKFDTVVTSEDGDINYTLINDCQISYKNITYTAEAIEGTVEFLSVGDSISIQLNNLDDNNRIYFPESMIAQNGIFITNEGSTQTWERVTNLHTQELGNKYFKFGYDSGRSLPYVEFPSDIATLIGTGLNIRYIVSKGAEGNISAGTLTVLSSPDKMYDNSASQNEITDFQDYLTVSNLEASSNGADPESIDKAYMNFKRTIGTFNTLVTPRDYANYIYNIVDDSTLNFIVSNIQVADRRTDFNYSNNIVTYTAGNGVHTIYNTDDSNITPYDLCLYPLKPITTNYTEDNYNASFTPLGSQFVESNPYLNEAKDISHDFKELDSQADVYCFKNKYILDAKINTYDAVDYLQQREIIANVRDALYKNFNARMVEFGEEIPYEELLEVIQNADSRISSVILNEPILEPYVMDANGNDTKLSAGTTFAENARLNLAAKNVLNGRMDLFDFNANFDLEYGQQQVNNPNQANGLSNSSYSNIMSAITKVEVNSGELNDGYNIKDNEVIQFISPNLESERQYGVYVNYRFTSDETDYIPANSSYALKENDQLKVVYTDADTNLEYKITYTNNSIITNGTTKEVENNIFKPSFDLYKIDDDENVKSSRTIDGQKYWILSSNETIDKMVYVTTTLNQVYLPCYWITNAVGNVLFDKEDIDLNTNSITVLLQNGEYFMYSNKDLTELVILGSGTRLTLTNITSPDNFASWKIDSENILDIEDINSKGLAAFSSVNWQNKQLSTTPILVEEMNIVTFNSGDKVTIEGLTENLSTDFISLEGLTIEGLRSDGTDVDLDKLMIAGTSWEGRARLDLNITTISPQKILDGQAITLIDKNSNEYQLVGNNQNPMYLGFNYNVQFTGSSTNNEKIDLTTRNISGIVITIEDGLDALVYKYYDRYNLGIIEPVYPQSNNQIYSTLPIYKNENDVLPISLSGFGSSVADTSYPLNACYVELPLLTFSKDLLIMMYYEEDSTHSPVTVTSIGGYIGFYGSPDTSNILTLNSGMNIIRVVGADADSSGIVGQGVTSLRINHGSEGIVSKTSLYVGVINLIKGISSKIDDSIDETRLLNTISTYATIDGKNMFYYLNKVDNDVAIDFGTNDTILSPRIFWDKNNLANRFTIAQIDFTNSVIEISKSSQKQ